MPSQRGEREAFVKGKRYQTKRNEPPVEGPDRSLENGKSYEHYTLRGPKKHPG